MQTLRHARFLVRLVLTWFVLALGVAIASPLVKPQSMELVCTSGSAMKLIVKSDEGDAAASSHHTLDCPLCATVAAPPPTRFTGLQPPPAPVRVIVLQVAAHVPDRVSAPLPARGPPATH